MRRKMVFVPRRRCLEIDCFTGRKKDFRGDDSSRDCLAHLHKGDFFRGSQCTSASCGRRISGTPYSQDDFDCGLSGAGFSLWGLVLAKTKTHRLKPAPLKPPTFALFSFWKVVKKII